MYAVTVTVGPVWSIVFLTLVWMACFRAGASDGSEGDIMGHDMCRTPGLSIKTVAPRRKQVLDRGAAQTPLRLHYRSLWGWMTGVLEWLQLAILRSGRLFLWRVRGSLAGCFEPVWVVVLPVGTSLFGGVETWVAGVSWLCSPPGRSAPSRSFDEATASSRPGGEETACARARVRMGFNPWTCSMVFAPPRVPAASTPVIDVVRETRHL